MIERPRNFMDKYEKNTIKKEQGITLISLTVTIIVMIILAGATISLVTGDNGMVAKAKEIKANIEKAQQEGQNRIDSLKGTTIANDGTTILNDEDAPTINSMDVTYVTDTSFKVSVNVTETGSGLAKIEYSIDGGEHFTTPQYDNRAKSYTFDDISLGFEEYNVVVKATDVEGNSSSATKKVEKLKIGDYVNYTYDEAGDYTVESTVSGTDSQTIAQTTGLKWRVLNFDKVNGTIDLISEQLTSSNIKFAGILGYNNGPYLMNKICEKQYSNSVLNVSARSLNLLDIEKHLTADGISARNACLNGNSGIKYGNVKTYTGNQSYYPALYAKQKGAGINTTSVLQPDITKGNDPYDESKPIADTEPTTDETKEQATASGLTATETYYDILINNENYGDAETVVKSSQNYWIASRYVFDNPGHADFGLRLVSNKLDGNDIFRSEDRTLTSGSCGLRPVVTLKTKLLDFTKDSDGAWNLK